MSAGVIKEFLVKLGYKVDEGSQRRFVDGVNNATGIVKTLGRAVEALTVGAVAYGAVKWLDNMASGMEGLYYAAKRAGDRVGDLQAFGYAASQMGSSFEQATASAQAMFQWLRNNPNAAALLQNNLGISATDANGNPLSGPDVLRAVGEKLSGMPGYRQKQYADLLNIPLELRMALMQSGAFSGWESQFAAQQKKQGVDPEKDAANAMKFEQNLRSFMAWFNNAKEKIASVLIGPSGLGKSVQKLLHMLSAHVPQIAMLLKRFVDAAIPVISSFIDWLSKLSRADVTNGLKAFGVVLAALIALKLGGMVANVGLLAARFPVLAAAMAAALAVLNAVRVYQNFQKSKAPGDQGPADPVSHFFKKQSLLWDALSEASNTPNISTARAKYKAFLDEENRPTVDMSVTRYRHMGGPLAGHAAGDPQSFLRSLEKSLGLPSGLLDSIWNQESGRGAHMLSSAGAMGHFQFMPKTAALYGVSDPNNFRQSATGAAHLLANLMQRYGGNLDMVLAAYNWGEKNLSLKGLENAPRETREYIRSIHRMMGNPYRIEHAGRGAATDGKTSSVNVKAETNIHVSGAGDPQAVGAAVASRQDDTHRRLARNLRVVVS